MSPAENKRVQELFDAAAALPRDERAAWVEREAAGEPDVEASVKALLRHVLEPDGADPDGGFDRGARLAPEGVAEAFDAVSGGGEPPWRVGPGGRVGDYRVVRVLDEGGMGVVCEAEDLRFPGERHVALKILKDEFLGPTRRERFLREATAAGRLEHPSIARVYATGSDGPLRFLALELIDGPSLADVVAWRRAGSAGDEDHRGRRIPDAAGWRERPTEMACRVALTVARALEFTHAHRILHRDVKPSNVLLRPVDGRPVLTDFGLARSADDRTLTVDGDILGTLSYVAPEQARGAALDGRADVYSLGATLFELLSLEVPFPADSPLDALARVVAREEAPPVRTLAPDVPRDLDRVVATALEKDVGRRYPSAAAFADDLERFLAYRPVAARSLGPVTRLVRAARQHKAIAASVLLALLLLAAGTVAAFVYRHANARSSFAAAVAAARRGDWVEALDRYAEAERHGYGDDVALAIGRIEAWQGRAENARAMTELARLAGAHDLGAHRAKVLLLRGLIGHNRWVDPDAGLDDLRAALSIEDHPLAPADAAFARSYLATSLVDAKLHLEEALRHDPAHHGAIANLAFVSIVLGRTAEADGLLTAYRALTPENPNALATQVLLRAMNGDVDRAASMLAEEGASLSPPVRDALELGLELVGRFIAFAETHEPFGSRDVFGGFERTRRALAPLLLSAGPLLALLRGQERGEIGVEVALPPVAARLAKESVAVVARLALGSSDDLLARTTEMLEVDESSVIRMLRGSLHYAAGRYREAELDFSIGQRAPGPAILPIASLCRLGEFSSQIRQLEAFAEARTPPPPGLPGRLADSLREIAGRGGQSALTWRSLMQGASRHLPPAALVEVAVAWRREHPLDPEATEALRGTLETTDAP